MNRNTTSTLALIIALVAAPAFAAPKITVAMKAEKDIVVVENGKQMKKRVEAKDQASGEVIIYTVSYRNESNEIAQDIRVANKIPAGTTYIADSATGDGDIVFSADNGKTYKKPAQVTYEIVNANGKKETVKATPEKYTDIRWVIPQVAAGGSGQVGYEVRVK
ncbi:MAG: hypothetical protein ACOY9J_00330 [Pseudomonadota bacterium]